ncbi:MAG: hypothetical protein J6Y54_09285, partial [Lentisphaeria bacterium]|nr:hypothetical protein [Lentisphaeria bacterium]
MAIVIASGVTSTGLILGNVAGAMDTTASAFGTAVNTIVSNGGALYVSNGGDASGTIISGEAKGQEILRAGGVAYDTVVNQKDSYQYVNGGTAYRTVIITGSQWGNTNAKLYDAIVRGGYQIVGDTVTAYNTVVSGGSQVVSNGGVVSGVVMVGGSVLVSGGASVNDAVISGGRFSVWGGGTVNNITVVVGNGQNAVIRPEANGTIFTGNLTMDFTTAVAATTSANYFLSSVARVAANPDVTYTIKVKQEGQYSGEYCMGGGSTNLTMTVVTDTGLTLGNVSGGGSVNGDYLHTQFGSYRLYTSTYQYVSIVADPVAIFNGATVVSRGITVDDASVGAGVLAFVRKGGTLNGATVQGSGTITVYADGIANGTTLDATSGSIQVSSGGSAINTTVQARSAWVRIYEGGFASGGTVTNGGVHVSNGGLLRGISIESATGGVARVDVFDGGVASDVEVNVNGIYMVSSGGLAVNTIIRSGYANISSGGVAKYTTISGGTQLLQNDAVASNTVISGDSGYQRLMLAGAKAYDTVISAGSQVLSAADTEAYRTVAYGGMLDNVAGRTESTTLRGTAREMVRDGATATSTIIDEGATGNQFVRAGGIAYNTIVRGGSQQLYDANAKAYDTVVSAGELQVFAGASAVRASALGGTVRVTGVASDTVVNGGAEVVEVGGVASNTVILANSQYVRGTAYDTVISAGQLQIGSNTGVAYRTVVSAGTLDITAGRTESTTLYGAAREMVRAGATTTSTTIEAGATGNQFVRAGGVTYYTTVRAGSQQLYDATATAYDTVVSGGEQQVFAGASAVRTVLSNGKIQNGGGLVSGAELFGVAANRLYVSNGGVAIETVLHDLSIVDVTSGTVISTTLYDGTQELLRSGGVASGAIVSGGAQKVLSSGAVASDTVVYAGYQQVNAGASAWNTTIVAGSNGNVNLADGAVTGGTWNFDLSQGAPTDTAMLNAWRITSGTDLVITVKAEGEDPYAGKYYLSSGASYFGDTTFTVKDTNGATIAENFGNGSTVKVGNFTYKLSLEGSGLYLTVSGYPVEIYTGSTLTAYGTVVTGEKIVAGMSAFVNDGGTLADAAIIKANSNKVIVSSGGKITGAKVYGFGTGTDIRVYGGGSASGTYLADDRAYLRLSGGTGADTTVVGGQFLMYGGASASNTTVIAGGVQKLLRNKGETAVAAASNTTVSSGGWIQVGATLEQTKSNYLAGGDISGVNLLSGGTMYVEVGATAADVTLHAGASAYVYSGGQIAFTSIESDAQVNVRFSQATGNTEALITDWGTVAPGAKISVKEVGGAGSFKIADSVDAGFTVNYDEFDVFGGRNVSVGQNFSDAFRSLNFVLGANGTLTVADLTIGTQATAAALSDSTATTLTDGALATTWTTNTDLSTIPTVAGANTNADAWLILDGAAVNGALYGAEGNFGHDVNLKFRDGSIKNLAAGATAGGSVANVNVMIGDIDPDWTVVSHGTTFNGVAYAGGFGSVTGTAGTVLNDGTFKKDFYAGALANKLDNVTSVGDVSMTIDGGTFNGNIYGASAVKTDSTKGNGTRHTAGDVTLTVTGGETTRGGQAC